MFLGGDLLSEEFNISSFIQFDTIGAIVGSIAEARFGIPKEIKEKVINYLPDDMRAVYQQFEERAVG